MHVTCVGGGTCKLSEKGPGKFGLPPDISKVCSALRTTSDVAVLVVAGMMLVDILPKKLVRCIMHVLESHMIFSSADWTSLRRVGGRTGLFPTLECGLKGSKARPTTTLPGSFQDKMVATASICLTLD